MKWFSEREELASEKNGSINIERNFGAWQVRVDGCGQTTPYTNTMWADAFKRVSRLNRAPETALMLGLGAAGAIGLLHKQFPIKKITAVEYDSKMISLAHRLGLYRPYPFPEVLEGDAGVIVATLSGDFDLIIVDLFNGPWPSILSTETAFIQKLGSLLAPNGVVLINVFRKPGYLTVATKTFRHSHIWKFNTNCLGIFSQQPLG